MATFVVTLSNYNNAAFWSSISESGGGHTLDFSALPSGFHVSFDPDARIVWVWDGSDWISISEQGYGGSFQLGAPTQFSAFDTIITGDANTSMEGDAGAETFETGDGTDSINAGGGSDTVAAGGGNDTVDGGTGNDSISGGGGDDHLLGGSGADTISGNTGNDSILGGADNDALQGGEGQDTIIGGTGNDAIIGDGLWLQVAEHASAGGAVTDLTVTNSADGAIKIWWINGNGVLVDYGTIAVGQTVSLSTYVDDNWILRDLDGRFLRLIEGAANQTVDFGATGLNDYIDGGSGSDLIYGQYGDDTIFYGTGLDTVYGGDGNDLIDDATGYNATSNPALLYGDAGDDTIYGTAGNDTIYGGSDNDLIGGEGGNDSLFGDAGNDTLHGHEGNDSLSGGSGNDSLDGGSGNDTILGGTGNDTISGSSAGNGGSVSWTDVGNNANVVGTTGTNYFRFDATTDSSVTITLDDGGGTVNDGDGQPDYILINSTNNVDKVFLRGFDHGVDRIVLLEMPTGQSATGTTGKVTVTLTYANGNAQTFTIEHSGGAGYSFNSFFTTQIPGGTADDDHLDGGDDADTFLVEDDFGNDTIIGGEGGTDDDTIDLSALTGAVTVTYTGNEAGTITDGTDTITFSQIERVILSDNGDSVDGTLADAINVVGGDGADTIIGGNTTNSVGDTIDGGAGDDSIEGLWGADTLSGGAGNDTIDGGDQGDLIHGGDGDDRIEAGEENTVGDDDTIYGGDGNDTITSAELDERSNDNIYGEAGADYINVTGGDANLLDGGADNDTIISGTGNDTLVGGAGDDRLMGGSGNDSLTGGTGNDTLTGDNSAENLISNGDFGNALTGWTVNNPTGGQGPVAFSGGALFNGAQEAVYGDSIEQDFTAPIGLAHTVSMTLREQSGGAGDHTFQIDLLDDSGTVIATETHTVFNGGSITPSFTFVPTTATSTLRITNTTSTSSNSTDAIVDNVSIVATDTGTGNDTLVGGAGADLMDGGGGDDTFIIEDGFGADTIIGGEGGTDDDTIDLSALTGPVTVTYTGNEAGTITDGTDTITFSEIEHINLTDQGDFVDGNLADAINISGGDGDDTIIGGNTTNSVGDTIDGGAGNDTIIGGFGNDTLVGGAGDDRLEGGAGDDSLEGGAGNDIFLGDSISEVALSIGGTSRNGINPQFEVYADGVLIHTGEVTWAQDGTSSFNPNAAGAFQTVNVALPDGLPASVEVRFINDFGPGDNGTPGDRNLHLDSITVGDTTYEAETDATISDGFAGAQAVNLFGMGSSATFDTSGAAPISGNDHMEGGDGADTFILDDNFGNDTIIGGEGGTDDDAIDLSAMNGPVTVTYTGNEVGAITDGTDTITFSEIERIVLTDQADSVDASDVFEGVFGDNPGIDVDAGGGNDTINGSWGGDTIDGGAGDDVIDADYGDDSVTGGSGQDTLLGGSGNDTLEGGDGDDSIDGGLEGDTLAGGAGDDLITGGDGNDTFVYSPGDGADTITDFNFGNSGALRDDDSSNNDVIDLSAFYDSVDELRDDFNDDGVLNHSNSGSVDYSNNSTLDENNNLTFNGADQSSFTADNTGVVCFTSGTAIRTPRGDVLIDDLRVGDLVSTLDNGSQPIRWIGQRHVGPEDLRTQTKLRPVLIPKGVLGASRPLLVSRQHAVLVGRDRLARAAHLTDINGQRVRLANGKRHVTYIHLMFDAHQIIFAEDVAAESFYPGRLSLEMLDDANWDRFVENNPAFARSMSADTVIQAYGETARVVAKRSEVADLLLAPERLPSRMLA